MKFGIFDHLDRNNPSPRDYYEARLRIIEAYDKLGFYSYHVAEHHSTPIGMAPSPSVFLSAIAQRTTRLRFGPMIYILPLYHPLRLIEEICMLDQMSGGRLDVGLGRGSSPVEMSFYGSDPASAQKTYAENLEVLLMGLTEKTLDFHGEHYNFDKVPMELEPIQKPHPALWYGVHSPESADRVARQGFNCISLDAPADATLCFDKYREVWQQENGDAELPLLGIARFVVVADTDEAAMVIARRAYLKWHDSFTRLSVAYNKPATHPRPRDFDTVCEVGQGIAGSPETVAKALGVQIAQTGANYVVGQFAFGDLTQQEILASAELFASKVMPALS
ncbi:MAG: Flavin-dependent oxidoreductase, luciferase family [Chloroflexi bacterium]|jgi:alkanesulfonate monooxygenase SsuD/methylene tetrahydromethanopterin reductase-like flavin-dependent oxidoreductase (luciferase family)|nr:MAG: Flavin-dependent oxidoreductase, luciferase family [Chloroflexota bacterium]